jgi:hypothetical protein
MKSVLITDTNEWWTMKPTARRELFVEIAIPKNPKLTLGTNECCRMKSIVRRSFHRRRGGAYLLCFFLFFFFFLFSFLFLVLPFLTTGADSRVLRGNSSVRFS